MSLATLADLTKKVGTIPAAHTVRAQQALDSASTLINDEGFPDGGEFDPVPDRIRDICVEAAYRAYSNPDAAAQVAPDSISYGGSQRGAVFLTAAEVRSVRRLAGHSSMSSVTLVTPYSGDVIEDVLDEDEL